MGRPIFGYPNHADVATLSGGSWEASLPLANLQHRLLSRVARSTDAALASTQFDADLGSTGRAVRIAALPCKDGGRLTRAARWRVRASTLSDFGASRNLVDPDLSAWAKRAGTTVLGGQTDSIDGQDAVVITDSDPVAFHGILDRVNAGTFSSDGEKSYRLRLKAGTSPSNRMGCWDQSVGAWRHLIHVTWSGGVPSLSTSVGSGSRAAVDLGDGWWEIRITVDGVIAANNNDFYLDVGATVGVTGTTYAHEPWVEDGTEIYQHAYDSGWLDVYPVIYPAGVLDVDDPGYFDGKLTQEQWADGYRIPPIHVLGSITTARYWRVEIDDTANPDGYVELGRLFLAHGYMPSGYFVEGAALGHETSSTRTETDGGAWFHNERPVRRQFHGTLGKIDLDEALARPYDAQRLLGTSTQFFFVFDAADTHHLHRRAFPATLRELSPLQIPSALWWDSPVAVVEEL